MKTLLFTFAALLQVGAVCAGELPDSVVEKTLGISGVQHTTKTQIRSGMTFSDATYQTGAGKDLVTLRTGTAEQYALWKQVAAKDARAVSGLGDDAFRYQSARSVCAKAQAAAVCASASYDKAAAKITDAQLQALVKAAL